MLLSVENYEDGTSIVYEGIPSYTKVLVHCYNRTVSAAFTKLFLFYVC